GDVGGVHGADGPPGRGGPALLPDQLSVEPLRPRARAGIRDVRDRPVGDNGVLAPGGYRQGAAARLLSRRPLGGGLLRGVRARAGSPAGGGIAQAARPLSRLVPRSPRFARFRRARFIDPVTSVETLDEGEWQ